MSCGYVLVIQNDILQLATAHAQALSLQRQFKQQQQQARLIHHYQSQLQALKQRLAVPNTVTITHFVGILRDHHKTWILSIHPDGRIYYITSHIRSSSCSNRTLK